jgi:hypothetical protein
MNKLWHEGDKRCFTKIKHLLSLSSPTIQLKQAKIKMMTMPLIWTSVHLQMEWLMMQKKIQSWILLQ